METSVILTKLGQFLPSLSLLIILHELGHFLAAKYFKTRVERFYLFFNPWFSLFKITRGETTYGIGWLPLGGYVKIAGMVDESMDTEQMKKDPEPWEFRSKPAWQRLIIMLGGIIVNVIVGVLIYAGVLFAYGERQLPAENLTDGIWVTDSLGHEFGFRTGDQLISANGEPIADVNKVIRQVMKGGTVEVMRDGNTQEITIPKNFVGQASTRKSRGLFMIRVPFIIEGFADSVNMKSDSREGLDVRDWVIGIGGTPVKYFDEVGPLLSEKAGEQTTVKVIRNEEEMDIPVTISDKGKLGVALYSPKPTDLERLGVYEFVTKEYSFFASFPAGAVKAVNELNFYIEQMSLLLDVESGAYKGIGGLKSIANLFPGKWSWEAFWTITAFLSLILAFMNLLPIPALDGGYVMFLIWEMVTGKPVPVRFMEVANMVGLILLVSLLAYANLNDWVNLF